MTDRGPLTAVSPLDGRYASYTEPLVPYASESALMGARVEVEVEYLCALADLEATGLDLDGDARADLRALAADFDRDDAAIVSALETEGWGDYPATNHDVKAVEYFLREQTDEAVHPWIHFALTSEDVNNLAHRLMVRGAVTEVLLPALRTLRDDLAATARDHRDVPMLARTHGQPATPTTYGKELAVYASRLGRAIGRLDRAARGLRGKLAGAAGDYAAHHLAYPDVDWRAFTRSFLTALDLGHEPVTTQVNPSDDLAELFDAVRGVNLVLLDLALDAWLYVSQGYLEQSAVAGETGSSTMPHKVNPIDFENAEGNLSKANADLSFLAEYITSSRLQRDLSDSTVKRTIGTALGHCHVGYVRLAAGLDAVAPNVEAMQADLEAHPEVLGEAIQTILRREGDADAYERVRDLTRGESATLDELRALLADLDLDEEASATLRELTPATYVGLADELVDDIVEE